MHPRPVEFHPEAIAEAPAKGKILRWNPSKGVWFELLGAKTEIPVMM
jgi:hypothetical protein